MTAAAAARVAEIRAMFETDLAHEDTPFAGRQRAEAGLWLIDLLHEDGLKHTDAEFEEVASAVVDFHDENRRLRTLVEQMGAALREADKRLHHKSLAYAPVREALAAFDSWLAGRPKEDDVGGYGEAVMPRIDGKSFRCSCGANVFTRVGMFRLRCNGCLTDYESVPMPVTEELAGRPEGESLAARVQEARRVLATGREADAIAYLLGVSVADVERVAGRPKGSDA